MLHSTVKIVPLSSLIKVPQVDTQKRRTDRFREVQMDISTTNGEKGSSSVEIGLTKVVCFIDGPKEPTKSADVEPLEGQISVFVGGIDSENGNQGSNTGIKNVLESALQSTICLNLYAKAQIDVEVTILADRGGVLAACLMATSLALVDAGIQVYDLCVAAHVVLLKDESLLIDPSDSEIAAVAQDFLSVTIGLMPSLRQVVCCEHVGIGTQKHLKNAISSALDASLKMYPFMLQTVEKLAKIA